jgi:hypothetical protein
MASEASLQVFVVRGIVRHDHRFLGDVLADNRNDRLAVNDINLEAASLARCTVNQ